MVMAEGERLGPFLLLERIGRGGMGEVWLAQPVSIPGVHDLCVVKTVRAEQADDPDAVRRFADESRLAMLLNHPHISRVVDAGRAGDVRYLALALVEGVDLLTLLRRLAERRRMLDEIVALWVGACMLDALAFAHDAKHPITGLPLGVVHRDISPQNVMCAKTGDAHVIDFGLALSSVKQSRTEQDVVLGKLSYMAPEQARASPVDQRTDIYATGVVLYEIINGRRYWGDLEHRQIWMKAGYEDWVPPDWRDLPPDVAAFLSPMIARDVKRRSTEASERLEAIMPLLISRGGPREAATRLAALVKELAVEELRRAERARQKARIPSAPSSPSSSSLQEDAPTEGIHADARDGAGLAELPADTQSIAIDEAVAIAAALATKTAVLPVDQLPQWPRAEPATAQKHDALDDPGVPTEDLERPQLPGRGMPTASAAPAALVAPPTRPLMMQAQDTAAIARSKRAARVPLIAAALVAVLGIGGIALGVGVAIAIATKGSHHAHAAHDAGDAHHQIGVVQHVDGHTDAGAGAAELLADAGAAAESLAGADAGTAAVVSTPEVRVPPVKRSLDDRLRALAARCTSPCVGPLQGLAPLEKQPAAKRDAITRLLTNCERTCRGAR